ncbi:helix-turn-helix domain-containing protein [Actinoplanes sp. TRM 88003]|uniref:Helix-turn-helix domain-containing protein n=1 Tax=Paractinoplanes aksuensis TaxID=2939490 RepID=A0ABT1E0M0_9ACTN|nr:helix-turn-helix domain-containing protein [Actinoplanes aksuensis]MCO8276662.1 helix-turn-helix domain-containing protein [Actinoplanes aksuensis]
MTFVFETAPLPPRRRLDAYRSLLVDTTAPSTIELDRKVSGHELHAQILSAGLGSLLILNSRGTLSHTFLRTPRQVSYQSVPMITVAVMRGSQGRHEQFGHDRPVPRGSLLINDLRFPYRLSVVGANDGLAVQIPIAQLGLDDEVIRTASPRLGQSPLYELMAAQVTTVATNPGLAHDPGVAAAMEASTVALARALLVSAAGQQPEPASIAVQVRAYIAQHLGDPGLGPESIAAALNMSVRNLYHRCAEADLSIEKSIVAARLRAARAALADPARAGSTVAVVARASGFRDPAHFSRRFRAEYDMTPSEWRALNRVSGPGRRGRNAGPDQPGPRNW